MLSLSLLAAAVGLVLGGTIAIIRQRRRRPPGPGDAEGDGER